VDTSRVTPREREDIEIMKIESLIAQARWKALEPALKKYLREYPEGRIRAKAVRSLAEVLVQAERWDEASRFLEKSIPELDEGVERARMEHLLARVYTNGDRYALAVDSLRKAIRMVPDKRPTPVFLADAYYLLGENLMALGQFREAAEVLKAGAARFPEDALQGWALYEAGSALQHVGQSEAASKALKELSSSHASDFWGRMVQGLKKDIDWWKKHEQLRN
jgi:TolA-binding protein